MAATSQALENFRRADVERRWPRHQWDAEGRSRWAGWDWRNYLYIIILALLISATVLEMALLNGENEPWWPFGLLTGSSAGLVVLALLIFGNGWLVDTSLADRTPGERLVPGRIRWLRRIAVSVPVVGLYTIPVWHWIVRTRPEWAFRLSAPPALEVSGASGAAAGPRLRLFAWWRSQRQKQGQSLAALLGWLIAGQLAPWLAILSWLTTAETLKHGHRTLLLGLTLCCHVLACALGVQYGVIRRGQLRAARGKASALRIAPLSFLCPFPFFILGLALWMISAGEDEETLVGRSHSTKSRRGAAVPLATGSALGRLLRSAKAATQELDLAINDLLPGTLENNAIKGHQLAFYRLKTFVLMLDAAALAWVSAKLGGPALSFESSWIELSPFLLLAAIGVVVELSFLFLRVLGWVLRRNLPYQAYGRSLTFTQLALAAGLLLGPLLAAGAGSKAGLLLRLIGLGTAIASTLLIAPVSFLLMLPGRQTFLALAWAGLFFEIFVTGVVMQYHPELAPPFLHLFAAAVALTPVWSFALFCGLRGWLLRPFQVENIFDGRLPGRARAALAAVALTAAIPLGGIAIPFWIYAQHRLWPRYEKLLWSLKRS